MISLKTWVVALFAAYWLFVVALLLVARGVYDGVLAQSVRLSGDPRPAEIGTLMALTALLALLSTGVIRGWRWIFWVILLAFLASILHTLVSALQLAGTLPYQGPAWYVALQGSVGALQFAIGLAMLASYRAAGVWAKPCQRRG